VHAGALMRTPVHGRARRRDRADHGVYRGQESVQAGGDLSARTVIALRPLKMGFTVERAGEDSRSAPTGKLITPPHLFTLGEWV